jgi:hypothetical protein
LTAELLLRAIIDNRNAVGKESECKCVLEEGNVIGVVGKTRLILVFGKGADERGILAIGDDEIVFILYTGE